MPYPLFRAKGMRNAAGFIRPPQRGIRLRMFVLSLTLLILGGEGIPFAQTPPRPAPGAGDKGDSQPIAPPGTIQEEDLLKTPKRTSEVPLHTVVIDPGHGGRDTGIRAPEGLLEKNVVLAVARKLSRLIQGRIGIRVVLTRTGDQTLPLLERTAIANHSKGQLFISLHAEGDFRREAEGFRVFILGPSSPPKSGKPPAAENGRLQAILWNIAHTAYLNESGRFGRLVADALSQETGLRAAPVREAQLLVLRGARMPSVVVSLGHLTNPREESLLEKDEFVEKLALALFHAIQDFIKGKDLSG